ncbi:hypothetical protein DL771_005426 [Monosporascus sp. 5C6A]|nr:hypothetical protein DL771_005426 [Monosporascus sp. 5C6A]
MCDDIATNLAASVGIHGDAATSTYGSDELDKEMRRRTFCNLYVWDGLISRQLGQVPFLPGGLKNWPRMRLLFVENDDMKSEADAPKGFTNRLLQARLSDSWKTFGLSQDAEYVMMEAEEGYEKFCKEFLASLPCAFTPQPDRSSDKRLPKLPLQRQFYALLSSIPSVRIFGPLLLKRPGNTQSLPAMLGGSHTRFAGFVSYTFEAAVLLVYLCTDQSSRSSTMMVVVLSLGSEAKTDSDPLRLGMTSVT